MPLSEVVTLHLTDANTLHVPGPAHHTNRIFAHLSEHHAGGPACGRAALQLASDAIAIAWAQRPDDYADLTYPQCQQLIRDRYWSDIVGEALGAPGGPGPVRAAAIVSHITHALLSDPQLNDRPQQTN
ncbi:hypothetical protein [Kitasatospora cineracea]|uniref:hypothetical protein n=1 Tax=Kitasatospora cineracea TaxID=88074 RepID=UPI0033F876FB